MKIHKKNIIAVSLITLGLCFGLVGLIGQIGQKETVLTPEAPKKDTQEDATLPENSALLNNVTEIGVTSKQETSNFLRNADWLYATFSLEGQVFKVPFLKGETILDAMTNAMHEDMFTFSGKEFSGIGFFVNEINGKKAERGKNFILWINGKKAEVGVSGYQLVAGDIISWTYEDNY